MENYSVDQSQKPFSVYQNKTDYNTSSYIYDNFKDQLEQYYKQQLQKKEEKIQQLKETIAQKDSEIEDLRYQIQRIVSNQDDLQASQKFQKAHYQKLEVFKRKISKLCQDFDLEIDFDQFKEQPNSINFPNSQLSQINQFQLQDSARSQQMIKPACNDFNYYQTSAMQSRISEDYGLGKSGRFYEKFMVKNENENDHDNEDKNNIEQYSQLDFKPTKTEQIIDYQKENNNTLRVPDKLQNNDLSSNQFDYYDLSDEHEVEVEKGVKKNRKQNVQNLVEDHLKKGRWHRKRVYEDIAKKKIKGRRFKELYIVFFKVIHPKEFTDALEDIKKYFQDKSETLPLYLEGNASSQEVFYINALKIKDYQQSKQ